jgi:hypothetical protein
MTDHRQRTLYNHESSKDRRRPEKPDPVAAVRERHQDEKATLGTKHRREGEDLEQKFNQERLRDPYRNDPPDADKRRRALADCHAALRDKMEQRHRAELSTAQKQHTIE